MQAQTAQSGPREIRAFMAARGFVSCDVETDVAALHDLATQLIPGEIASVSVMAGAQHRTGHSLFLLRHGASPTAFIACLALTRAGEAALCTGRFNGLQIAPEWIAPFGASTRAGYIWGLGGVDRASAFAAMRALRVMRKQFFAHLELYARASTPDGAKLMEGFGYRRFPGADKSVLRAPAVRSLMAHAS